MAPAACVFLTTLATTWADGKDLSEFPRGSSRDDSPAGSRGGEGGVEGISSSAAASAFFGRLVFFPEPLAALLSALVVVVVVVAAAAAAGVPSVALVDLRRAAKCTITV